MHQFWLQVKAASATLDFVDGVNAQGFQIPALTVRRVETAIELSDGQSFAIGGLLDTRDTVNFSKIPFIGDLPILSKLFQSKYRHSGSPLKNAIAAYNAGYGAADRYH